jgi:predicted flavoprotein YhiN
MSASKTKTELLQPISIQSASTVLNLSPTAFRIRKSGIEFRSDKEVAMWTEMTVELQLPGTKSFSCSGVVVASSGNRHTGYNVSLVFTSVTRQAQERLNDFSSIAAISLRA